MIASMEGGRVTLETKNAIDNSLQKLTTTELYEIVSEMKMLIQRDKTHASNLMAEKPELAHALLGAQIMLGMAQQPPAIRERELFRQVMELTQEQMDMLDPAERDRLLQVREQFMNDERFR